MDFEIFEHSSEQPRPEKRALTVAVEAAKRNQRPLTIVVPAKKHATSTSLKYLLSEHDIKSLLKGKSSYIAEGVIARLESNATVKTLPHDQILLVIRGWRDAIAKLKKVSNIRTLIVVSPSSEETEKWKAAFSDERPQQLL